MSTDKKQHHTEENDQSSPIQPDPETLNTTDPQEHMKGPVSSTIKKIEEIMENDGEKENEEKPDKK